MFHAWFITGSKDIPGKLGDTDHNQMDRDLLDWFAVYFKEPLAEFTLDTTRAEYMSLARIEFEDELPPSFDALWRHWQWTCWVSNMWNQGARNHMSLLDLTLYG